MPTMARVGFARRVRGLSRDRLARLVADLWRARGREVRLESGAVVATDPATGRTERLWIAPDGPPADGPSADGDVTDRVVAVARRRRGGDRDGPEAVDVDELYQLLRFAVDRDAGDAIAEEHLGRPLVTEPAPADEGPGPEAAGEATAEPAGPLSRRAADRVSRRLARQPRSHVLFAVGAGLLLLVGVIGAAGSPFGPDGGPAMDPTTPAADAQGLGASSTDLPAPTASTANGDRADPPVETPSDPTDPWRPWRESRQAVREGPLPPGLDEHGIADADALAEAHVDALRGRSYTLEITHREFVGEHPTAVARERVTAVSPKRYRSSVERAGPLRIDPLVIDDHSAYADGSYRYERHASHRGTAYLRRSPSHWDDGPTGRDRYTARVGSYIRWFLSVNESRVVGVADRGGTRYYWVVTEGEPFPGYHNARGSALVDEHGVVHELERSYDVPAHAGVSVRIEVRYTRFGNVTVDPPPWADEAWNETHPEAWRTETPTGTAGANATTQAGTATPAGGD